MAKYSDFKGTEEPERHEDDLPTIEYVEALPLPEGHPAEADAFVRQSAVPGHEDDQEVLGRINVVSIGAGGLGSFIAQGLVRSGIRSLIVVDPDLVDRTNLPRQLYFAGDLGQPKAVRLVRNIAGDAIAGARLIGMAMRYEEASEHYALPADLMMVNVDNNACRALAAREARTRRIPAIFTMLSGDGMRCQCFLQGPDPEDACLWCALPNLDPRRSAPCAAAVISSCFLAGALALFFAHRAVLGWPRGVERFNFREADLTGMAPEQKGFVTRRHDCPLCSEFARR
jgi:molybdopterin/thiamine biosynthesis adenylyltransferase